LDFPHQLPAEALEARQQLDGLLQPPAIATSSEGWHNDQVGLQFAVIMHAAVHL